MPERSMARRILILSYYFPPSGGSGVQRALKFVKYLPAMDWTPVVLTVQEGAYPAQDTSLWTDVPASAEVHRTRSWDPYRLYAYLTGQSRDEAVVQGSTEGERDDWKTHLARWVRANVFLPDARVGWVPFAVRRGRQLLADGEIDAIFTTGPPHSTHLAGALLQWGTDTPWIADFRDPWTDINYYQELPHTPCARAIDGGLERMVLRQADAVTTVSPTWRDLLVGKRNPQDAERFFVVQNGFDQEDMSPAAVGTSDSTETFELTHVGSLHASRNPESLWGAVGRLRDKHEDLDLRIRLVGAVDPNVWHSLSEHRLTSVTEHVSYVSHPEAVAYMRQAGLLILSIEQFAAAEGMMTGKIYEYLASERPVVGIGPPAGDAAALLQKTGGGQMFDWSDQGGLAQYIDAHYRDWIEGTKAAGASPEALNPYRRRVQTEQLAGILNNVSA